MNGTIDALGIRPVIDRVSALPELLPALRYLESAEHLGKIAISP